ncbi:MAG TPA: hypothetical protein V6C81_11670 [Planktothrix sp.]|jgi:hypothetical protein
MRNTRYTQAVIEFLALYGNQLYAARVQTERANWTFKQNTSKTNQIKLCAAQKALGGTASDTEAYKILLGLTQDVRFRSLDFKTQRALQTALSMYEENVSSDPERQKLQQELSQRKAELERLKTAIAQDEITSKIPDGHDVVLPELVRRLIIDRNRLARMRGFDDFYRQRMHDAGMDFDVMKTMVSSLKAAVDALQPRIELIRASGPAKAGLSKLFQRIKSPRAVLRQTAQMMGISSFVIKSILSTSDLYPRARKDGFRFVSQIDAPFDVRAHTNIQRQQLNITDVKSELIHEVFGHGVDCRSIDPDLHPLLRLQEPFTAESIAVMMESLVFEPEWLARICGLSSEEISQIQAKLWRSELESLVGNMRSNVATIEFEMELYRDPNQDLDLAYRKASAWERSTSEEEAKTAPGMWAVEIPHYVSYPCYCHNYLLGKAWAQQVKQSLRDRFGSFVSRRVGPYLARNRKTGLMYTPDQQILKITGKPFSSDALAAHLEKLVSSLEATITPPVAA